MLQTPAFRDPDAAARELVEIAGVEAVQDGRVYIERVNARRGAGQSPAHRKTRRRAGSAGGRYKANVTAFRTVTLRRWRGPDQDSATAPALKGNARDRGPVLGHRGARLCTGRVDWLSKFGPTAPAPGHNLELQTGVTSAGESGAWHRYNGMGKDAA